MYKVKEIFFTLQGEGARAGRAAVFCRFSGCNLWSGRDKDRARSSCPFCDTDFVGTDGVRGGSYRTANSLAEQIAACWPAASSPGARATDTAPQAAGGDAPPPRAKPYAVFTGGEPLLQLDGELIAALKERGFEVAVETNGTRPVPAGVDWITVSPKPGARLVQRTGHELKLLYPIDIEPETVAGLDFELFYLSPVTEADPAASAANTRAALSYCRAHPQWRLTMQHHKLWQIP